MVMLGAPNITILILQHNLLAFAINYSVDMLSCNVDGIRNSTQHFTYGAACLELN